jgi:hypothetical protein
VLCVRSTTCSDPPMAFTRAHTFVQVARKAERGSVCESYTKCVEWLEEHGLSAVSVKERDVSGRTLLFYASYNAHDSAVITRLLLSTKPSVETVNAQDERGETALHYAVRCFCGVAASWLARVVAME